MEKNKTKITSMLSPFLRMAMMKVLGAIIVTGLFILAISLWLHSAASDNALNGRFEVTAVQVQKLKDIGQWEFLSIADEELMDTVRHGFFSDDRLSRLYYGTLRLGIDMGKTSKNWIKTDHDTIKVTLPPVQLLDPNFIDEARTRAVYESGKWSEADKAMLTIRASETMKMQCITPQNIRSAEQNATVQFTNLLHSMGFQYVKISFNKPRNS